MRHDAVIKSHNSPEGETTSIEEDTSVLVSSSETETESVLSQFSFELRHDKITFVSDFHDEQIQK